MKLKEHQSGILLMFAGLSARVGNEAVKPAALRAWLDEEATSGTIDRETVWLFRTGYITTIDGEAYAVTEEGWAALDRHLIGIEEASRREERANGGSSPFEASLSAKEEAPDVLILMGEFEIKAEARRMTFRTFPNASPAFRSSE